MIYTVDLMPIEPMLFSDNRSARAGADHLIRDQDPSPHAIYGTIGAYLLRQLKLAVDSKNWQSAEAYLGEFNHGIKNDDKIRAELLGYCIRDGADELWFSKPKHVFFNKEKFPMHYASVQPKTGFDSLTDFDSHLKFDLHPQEEELETDVLVSKSLLTNLLCQQTFSSKANNQVRELNEFFKPELRLGIKMNNSQNCVEEGLFFSRPYRRFKSDVNLNNNKWRSVGFSAWYKTLQALDDSVKPKGVCFLGGDRRRAVIELQALQNEKPLQNMCTFIQNQIDGTEGFLAYLLTPAVREKEWPQMAEQKPVAAGIGKEITISGWNADRSGQHPRPILKLIPAGSVFFYKWPDNDTEERKKIISDYWFKPLSNNYKNSGFGRVLIGVWK
ncbi:hypothetical protein GX408_03410 [bacterium]|nr:hypothetical protein [bacterium]